MVSDSAVARVDEYLALEMKKPHHVCLRAQITTHLLSDWVKTQMNILPHSYQKKGFQAIQQFRSDFCVTLPLFKLVEHILGHLRTKPPRP